MANRKIILSGSELKTWLLKSQIDIESGKKISIREILREHGEWIGLSTRPSNWNYHCKAVKDYPPYAGSIVTEELAYQYAIDNNLISDVSFEDFSKQYNKKTNKLDEGTIMREVCKRLNWISPKDLFSNDIMEKTLVAVFGESYYQHVKNKVIMDLKAR